MYVYIYTKIRKNPKNYIYIYIKPDTFQKARQFALRFYSQKVRHFRLRGFHDFFEIDSYIYTKIMTLCVT